MPAGMASVGERFDTVATCRSGIATVRPVFQGSETPLNNPQTFISSSACNLRPGVGPDDMGDFENHINDVLGRSGLKKRPLLGSAWMRDHFPKENARFAQQTVSKKWQDGIFETSCSLFLMSRLVVGWPPMF